MLGELPMRRCELCGERFHDTRDNRREHFRRSHTHAEMMARLRKFGLTGLAIRALLAATVALDYINQRPRLRSAVRAVLAVGFACFCWQLAVLITGGR